MLDTPRSRRFGRLLALSTLTTLGLALGVGLASAHVTVNPNTATAGSYTKLTFRVPNESAKASTVGLTVSFPIDHPFASVSVKKQPGWTATVTTSKLTTPISDDDNATITQAVSSITWKADASGKIALGQFAEFDVSVGPVPDVPTIAFPAVQTYDDGSVVKWDEPTPPSGAEPEHPAPTLTISPASGEPTAGSDTSGSPAATAGATPTVSAGAEAARADNAARTLGVIAIVVAAGALLVAALGVRRRRSGS